MSWKVGEIYPGDTTQQPRSTWLIWIVAKTWSLMYSLIIFFVLLLLRFFSSSSTPSFSSLFWLFSFYLLLYTPLRFILHYQSLSPVQLVLYSCGRQIFTRNLTYLQQKPPLWCGSRVILTMECCGEIKVLTRSWFKRANKSWSSHETCNRAHHNLCLAPRVILEEKFESIRGR
jgi:hypothetical protein